jgi:undecaprenyl-diphosphatase
MSQPNPPEPIKKEIAPKPTRRYRAYVFQGVLAAAILGFALLAFLASTKAYFSIDLLITQALQTYKPAWFRILMTIVSWPGFMPQTVVISALLVLLWAGFRFRREARVSLFAIIGSGALNTLVKIVVHRPRPSADLVTVVTQLNSFSFPSGHVMFYTAFFGLMFFLIFTRFKRSWWRAILLILFGALVILVGPSRIYLGEHWASDVLAAYLLGSLILFAAIQYYRLGTRAPVES